MKQIALIIGISFLFIDGYPSHAQVKDPVPYPQAPQHNKAKIKKFSLEQILTYKKLPIYSENPLMTRFVKKGKILPVKQRLPQEPQVMMSAAMVSGPGKYGGVWRGVWAIKPTGFNFLLGQTGGWYGINAILIESLVKTGPIWMRSDSDEPLPNLAKSWDWSKDGHELTMYLIEGAKWSDGHLFTSEDIRFSWEDHVLDKNIKGWGSRVLFQTINSTGHSGDTKLVIKDDYTIKFIFAAAFPKEKLYNFTFINLPIMPSHILKKHHPKYNQKATYESYSKFWGPDFKGPMVTMSPWVMVKYDGKEMIMRANPYYWKVDEKGQQLPYLNEVSWHYASQGIERSIRTMKGLADHSNFEDPIAYEDAIKASRSRKAHFRLSWSGETMALSIIPNMAKSLGVSNEKENQVRKLLRNFKFRRALSHAIDRQTLSKKISKMGMVRAYAGGIVPGSIYYERKSVVYYDYDIPSAKYLLKELGFKDSDGNGIFNWTTGPLKGKDLKIQLVLLKTQSSDKKLGAFLKDSLKKVGIKLTLESMGWDKIYSKLNSGKWDLFVERCDQEYIIPIGLEEYLAPLSNRLHPSNGYYPHLADKNHPYVLQPFEKELKRTILKFSKATTFEERKHWISQYNKFSTENLNTIGLFVAPYGLGLAKRFENIPIGTPVFFYQWTWNNGYFERVWVKKRKRLKNAEKLLDTIPLY